MSMIDLIISQAQQDPRHIILPEGEDPRMHRAAAEIEEQGIARVTLVGNKDRIRGLLRSEGVRHPFQIVDPQRADWTESFAKDYHTMREHKGVTLDQAREHMRDPIPHGVMMLHKEMADGLVAGACHSTGDTLRPALQILRTAPGASMVSSFFFMSSHETTYLFADCALVEEPDEKQLAEIALATAESAMAFDIEPRVALLSYSTKGSAHSAATEKVANAVEHARQGIQERFGSDSAVLIDGELQADAAIIEEVGASKAPNSQVAGRAKVLIFPDLNSGNIGYKLVERLAGLKAYGPIIQGMRLPVNDLSRGCSVEDIVGVVAITAVQSQMQRKTTSQSSAKANT